MQTSGVEVENIQVGIPGLFVLATRLIWRAMLWAKPFIF
jgi:hypothetical protein